MKLQYVFILLLISTLHVTAQTANEEISDKFLFNADFFSKNDPLEITLLFNFSDLYNDRFSDDYISAGLKYKEDDKEITSGVRLKTRGEFRLKKCEFAPVWLNIKNSGLKDDYFKGVNKFKIVSQCRKTSFYNSCLLKEYLAYRIYNMISDYSFRVRLLQIKYVDSGHRYASRQEYAFIIEPEEIVAKRNGLVLFDPDETQSSQTDSLITTTMNLFQYMIGNTDFSMHSKHNIKLFASEESDTKDLIPVPYDFDFSGLVNADYASPHPTFDIKDVTERYYYGYCRNNDLYDQAINILKEKKDEIMRLIDSFDYINKRTKKDAHDYIQEFYNLLEHPDFIENYIKSTCIKI